MRSQSLLFVFYFVTSFGSALSSIASFLSIEQYFQTIIFLGFALSARTFASAIFSYISNHVIKKLGLRGSLIASQAFGCIALFVLFLGFKSGNFIFTLIGIMFTGLPSTFIAIFLSIFLKISSENDIQFRKYSSRREIIFYVALLGAAISAPLLLLHFDLNTVLFMDAVTYIIGLILVSRIKFSQNFTVDEEKPIAIKYLFFSSKAANSFILKTTGSLLLAGFIPLLASSKQIDSTANMPILLREWLWIIENITAISANILYLFLVKFRQKNWIEFILIVNCIWIFIPIMFPGSYNFLFITAMVSILIYFSFQKFRDDLILSAGSDHNLIKAFSALAQLQRNIILFLSPIILSFLVIYTSLTTSLTILLLLQSVLFIAFNFYSKTTKLPASTQVA